MEALLQQRRQDLERLARLSESEARALILKEVGQEALRDAADVSRRILEDARTKAETDARRILSLAIQRYAGDHTFETTTSTVALQGDDIKGRIIGREGRNIRAFEAATGITVLIDDTPNAVVLSGFDPVRREIAREAMERLILDGRIHPTRIEEVVARVTAEIDEAILRAGEEAVYQLGLTPLHVELLKLLGRLKFRRSFSQPEPFVPGQVDTVEFTMPDAFHTFRQGHRIMVQVQSTWFPLVNLNPQTFVKINEATEADFRKATERVWRTAAQPSMVRLNVVGN